jgi:ABC-type dipeptide/oligopeptide/nickel transport system permease subunit
MADSVTLQEIEAPKAARWFASGFLPLGGAIVLFYCLMALVGPALVPYGMDEQDLFAALSPPDAAHLLGTDPLGRDILSRIVIGARYTLSVTAASVALASVAGVALGLVSGFYGGKIDTLISSVVDLLLTIPLLILAIVMATLIGAGMSGLILATAVSFTPPMARLIRSRVLEIRQEEFVQAAFAVGAGDLRILARHVLPNTLNIAIIQGSIFAGQAVLVATALGFLGLGVQPPLPEWGTMIGMGREYLEVSPHLVYAPGLAISFLVLGLNLLGDGLRDQLDPRTRA